MTLNNLAENAASDLIETLNLGRSQFDLLGQTGHWLAESLIAGQVIFLCGNGGSAAEAQHLAAEFVGRFSLERPGLPAIALTTDTSILTAVGNDYGFEEIFARQIQALGRPGDILWGLSTSGQSPNVLKALALARERGLKTLFMCGPKIMDPQMADIIIPINAATTARIQEMHLFYGHLLCQMVENLIFSGSRS
ncbi:MAG: SIS domain-containing protein [Deltaproteobacteria bacterium]|nr:SIS domain-containing protein [Deltaproteobacteria bacterium]